MTYTEGTIAGMPGYYWVLQYRKSVKPTVARLSKNSGWFYMADEHSNKAISNSPFKVLSKIEEPNEQTMG